MENKVALSDSNNIQRLKGSIDIDTGLALEAGFESNSGFLHLLGSRNFGDLKIFEAIAKGVGVSYLNGIRVFDSENNLIVDYAAPNGIKYDRHKVIDIVRKKMLEMLEDAANNQNIDFDPFASEVMIEELLKDAYYTESYKSILKWARELNIIQ